MDGGNITSTGGWSGKGNWFGNVLSGTFNLTIYIIRG